jgi:hypothetical protein
MEQFFLYLALGVLGFGYFCSVIACSVNGMSDEWWEPLLMGAVLPFILLYEARMIIFSVVVGIGFLGAVVGLSVLIGDLFRWIWSFV